MAHSAQLWLVTWRYQPRIPVAPDICHRGCAYTILKILKMHGVYIAVSGTVHYREPLVYSAVSGTVHYREPLVYSAVSGTVPIENP